LATLSFPLSNVTLKSTWNCYQSGSNYVSSTPKKVTNTQNVAVSGIPSGAIINSAVLTYYIESSPNTGAQLCTINGITAAYRPGTYTVSLAVTGNGNYPVTFDFQAYGETHNHVQSHSSVLTFQNMTLTVDYTPAQPDEPDEPDEPGYRPSDWTINITVVSAGNPISVTISPYGSGYSHHLKATFGSYSSEASLAANVNVAYLPTSLDWLFAIPDSTTGTVTVILTTYYGSTYVGESYKTLTLTAPVSVGPTMTTDVTRILTVNGVTYPDVTGGYVQQKSAVEARITSASGAYGSTIKAYSINIGGRTEAAYNTDQTRLVSPLLPMYGTVSITFKVTDSRGMMVMATRYISVEAYTAPRVTNFVVKRVNTSGADDPNGTRGWYSFGKSFTSLGGKNNCTAKIAALGSSASGIAESGWIVPGNALTLNLLSSYQVQLTLTDSYESVTVTATIPSMNVSLHFSADGTAVWVGGTCEHSNAFGVASDREVYFYGQELRELIRSIVSEML